MNKVLWTAFAVLVAGALVTGIVTRQSYAEPNHGIPYDDYAVYPQNPYLPEKDLIFTEIQNADFIAKVTFTGERTHAYYSEKSVVKVEEVYLGDVSFENTNIAVYEYGFFGDVYPPVFNMQSNSPLMREGKSYYVFLKAKEYSRAYQETLPYHEFSPYPWEFAVLSTEDIPRKPLDPEKQLYYRDIADCEFVVFSDEEYERCMEIKRELIEMYCTSATANTP